MEDLLARAVELGSRYPAAFAGAAAVVLVGAFVWAVVRSSYRYR